MCHTQTQVDQPLTTPGSALPGGGTAGAGPANGDPLSSAIQSEAAANPKTASVTSPTKFGKLLSFVAPLAEGALVGGFGGRGHAGGGFGAATDYFNAKKDRALRQKQFDQQQQNANILNQYRQAQVALDAARTQHELGKPNFTDGRTTPAVDANGKPVLLRRNPITGDEEPIEGFTPPDKADKTSAVMTDKGLVAANSSEGTATPITIPGAPTTQSTPINSHAPGSGRFGGATASPQMTKQVPGPGVPLMPPGAAKDKNPKPVKVTNRGNSGSESDSLIDENPQSPTFGQTLKKNIAGRAPAPKEADNSRAIKAAEGTDAERYAGAAMDKFGGDPDKAIKYLNDLKTGDKESDAKLTKLLPLIRQHIRDRAKPGKTGKQPRLSAEDVKKLTGDTQDSSVLDDSDE